MAAPVTQCEECKADARWVVVGIMSKPIPTCGRHLTMVLTSGPWRSEGVIVRRVRSGD